MTCATYQRLIAKVDYLNNSAWNDIIGQGSDNRIMLTNLNFLASCKRSSDQISCQMVMLNRCL